MQRRSMPRGAAAVVTGTTRVVVVTAPFFDFVALQDANQRCLAALLTHCRVGMPSAFPQSLVRRFRAKRF